MVDAIADTVARYRGRGGYVHAYYPVFDALSHTYGSSADQVVAQFRRIDAAFASLLDRLSGCDCDIVASADHGFIDSPPDRRIHLDQHPTLRSMLAAPLFGEPRAAFVRVHPGAEDAFEAYTRETLGGQAVTLPASDLIAHGLLGPGKAHARITERVGTHALLMEPGWTLRDRVADEAPHEMIGFHGGLSPEEMWIPLIVAQT